VVVCHCEAVNDATIRGEIERGALTADEVASRCGAGGRCGGCRIVIDDLVDEMLARHLDRESTARVTVTRAAA
jgi:bacterioferritin-associated ferredoxin